jgi:integrase
MTLTVTDLFCGAGGSSQGAEEAGGQLALGLNHWRRAIDSHAANFPHAEHDCADISVCDPRYYPATDLLIASPECFPAGTLISDPWRVDADAGEIVELRARTMERRLSAIAYAHHAAGVDSPTRAKVVREALEGLYRDQAQRAREQPGLRTRNAKPITVELLHELIATCDRGSLRGLRDRALLVIGFAGAYRRSELVSLDWDDVEEDADGLRVTLGRSKTDQRGHGHLKGLPYGSNEPTCPVRALRDWHAALDHAVATLPGSAPGIGAGPIFGPVNRHGQPRVAWRVDGALVLERLGDGSVSAIVKERVRLALRRRQPPPDPGFVEQQVAEYSAHSLRGGFITTAARRRVPEYLIMRHTGHRTERVMRGYIEQGALWEDNPAAMLGL